MESFLESLSLALSEQTGFTPETCSYVVPMIALVLVLLPNVIAVLFPVPRPLEPPEVVPKSFEEAQPPATTARAGIVGRAVAAP